MAFDEEEARVMVRLDPGGRGGSDRLCHERLDGDGHSICRIPGISGYWCVAMETFAPVNTCRGMKKVGLTLGKYAPLHKGHQLVIETALAEMDQVFVLVYDAREQTRIPLERRAAWIRSLYPKVQVIEGVNGPTAGGRSPAAMSIQEAYVRKMLEGRKVSHFYSSEFYGEHMSRSLGALDRRVDGARTHIPISATDIRKDPLGHRHFLEPAIYRDLIVNVALLGAPSTGKSALAEALATLHRTCWMPEFGREYWEKHQTERRLSELQLLEIAQGHIEREEAFLQQSREFLFTDTNALTTAIFSRYYHGRVDPALNHFADDCINRYDLVLLCGDDIPYDATWDRSGPDNRSEMQAMIRRDLQQRNIPFHEVRGDLLERIGQVDLLLERSRKFIG